MKQFQTSDGQCMLDMMERGLPLFAIVKGVQKDDISVIRFRRDWWVKHDSNEGIIVYDDTNTYDDARRGSNTRSFGGVAIRYFASLKSSDAQTFLAGGE
jgi:hypothetical protein